jgi:hypothetical protein
MNAIWAMVCVLAVFAGGVGANLLGEEVKGWVARIPFAILWLAARRVPPGLRATLRAEWRAELIHGLRDTSERPISRLILGVRFAAGLVVGGKRVALELGSLRAPDGAADLTSAVEDVWLSGPPSIGGQLVTFFKKAYGVNLQPVGQGPHGEEIYRDPRGDVIEYVVQGACGSTYWQVFWQPAGREPVELMRCRTRNESGQVQDVRVGDYALG